MASFVNIMNNGLLRANLPPDMERRKYGITAYNHPLNLTKEQLTEMALYVILVCWGGIYYSGIQYFNFCARLYATARPDVM